MKKFSRILVEFLSDILHHIERLGTKRLKKGMVLIKGG